jgi:hypothetical protein
MKTNDSEDATELSTATKDLSQLKAGITFQEYVCCDNATIPCKVHSSA